MSTFTDTFHDALYHTLEKAKPKILMSNFPRRALCWCWGKVKKKNQLRSITDVVYGGVGLASLYQRGYLKVGVSSVLQCSIFRRFFRRRKPPFSCSVTHFTISHPPSLL